MTTLATIALFCYNRSKCC